ncbi:Mo25-like protein [Kockiozyma suomiensis]|uniref:Mo25-like protein n=1 Tax=Kockiozyma suomiensis TaxID=1337062 RepID=UPI0033432657
MAFLFSRSSRQKSPQELVRSLRDSLKKLDLGQDKKTLDEVTRFVNQIKVLVHGDGNTDPSPDSIALLAQEAYSSDLLYSIIARQTLLDFEQRKDTMSIFNALLQRQIGSRFPTVQYLSTREPILVLLVKGYEYPEVAQNSGQILRECIKHEQLAKIILSGDLIWSFFEYVQLPAFETASDAFSTLRDLLTRHKSLALDFLTDNIDKFFVEYNRLLQSSNYVTKRQSIKLLGEILLDRTNYVIMTAYIDSPEHLKLIMNLLRDKSKNIQYESFHVFKVFVANPNKSKPVVDILLKNREKLLVFLPEFQSDRTNDDQFNDEKQFLIRQIADLKPVQ